MGEFATQHNFSFPYLIDENQSAAKAYGAVCTPDFFGFNADLQLQYRGRLDNLTMGRDGTRTPELFEAMRMIADTGKCPRADCFDGLLNKVEMTALLYHSNVCCQKRLKDDPSICR